jgi:methionyl aminopeptidase
MLQNKKKVIRLAKPEREAMRRACRFNSELMDHIREHVKPGVSTGEIDRLVHEYTVKYGHRPAPLGYPGEHGAFPKSCCTSINDVICHGIPGDTLLQSGDIMNLDITSVVDGWHGDQSETFLIGEVSDKARAVSQCAFDCLWLAIRTIKPGCPVSHIGDAIKKEAEGRGFSVVREFVGHGVGRQFHQDPTIPHFPNRQSRRDRLDAGVCFTIEPMINSGGRHGVTNKRDGWTVRTRDGSLSAQFEHTVLMTETGPEVLTITQNGPQEGDQI